MQASARNQFKGVISEIRIGAVNAEVYIRLSGGISIIASVTKESVTALALQSGTNVLALVKAPQIMLVTDFGGYQLSARNQLPGIISTITPGAVNTEVAITLSGGEIIVATVTNDSVNSLALTSGTQVTAVFKAGAVILAVPV